MHIHLLMLIIFRLNHSSLYLCPAGLSFLNWCMEGSLIHSSKCVEEAKIVAVCSNFPGFSCAHTGSDSLVTVLDDGQSLEDTQV